jgi:hypothetical protein
LVVVLGLFVSLSGCILPAAWYSPGIAVRIGATNVSTEDIAEIIKILTAEKYELYVERVRSSKDVPVEYYLKDVTPSSKGVLPYVKVHIRNHQPDLSIDIENIYGRKDNAIENEIDSIGKAIYNELVKRLGEGKVTKERLLYGPPII